MPDKINTGLKKTELIKLRIKIVNFIYSNPDYNNAGELFISFFE